MRAYRIVKRKHAATAWTGYGAQTYGGRWNSIGRRAVYCAGSISLAMLEMLVHLNARELLERSRLFVLARRIGTFPPPIQAQADLPKLVS